MSLAAELGCTMIKAYKMDATQAVAVGGTAAAGQAAATSASMAVNVADPVEGAVADAGVSATAHSAACSTTGAADEAATIPTAVAGETAVPAGNPRLSAKAQQRLKRRLAAMAVRGHTPSAAEYRSVGVVPSKHPGFPPCSFDYILLDAPCTALGIRPRLLLPHDLELLLQTAEYQRKLLDVAVQLLKPGGVLVYSTCSINPGG